MRTRRVIKVAVIYTFVCFAVFSCTKQDANLPAPKLPTTILDGPTISEFSPGTGAVGSTVVINGSNFDASMSLNIVKFNGVTSVVSAVTSSSIAVVVPAGAGTGRISVTVNDKTATSAVEFVVSQ